MTWHAPEEVKAAFAARAAARAGAPPPGAALAPGPAATKPAPPQQAPQQILRAAAPEPADDPTIPDDDDIDIDIDAYEVEPVDPVEEVAPPNPRRSPRRRSPPLQLRRRRFPPRPAASSPRSRPPTTLSSPRARPRRPPPNRSDRSFASARVDGRARWDRWHSKLVGRPEISTGRDALRASIRV